MDETSFVWRLMPRVDGIEKVTGAAKYTDGLFFHDMLYGKVKRSPCSHTNLEHGYEQG